MNHKYHEPITQEQIEHIQSIQISQINDLKRYFSQYKKYMNPYIFQREVTDFIKRLEIFYQQIKAHKRMFVHFTNTRKNVSDIVKKFLVFVDVELSKLNKMFSNTFLASRKAIRLWESKELNYVQSLFSYIEKDFLEKWQNCKFCLVEKQNIPIYMSNKEIYLVMKVLEFQYSMYQKILNNKDIKEQDFTLEQKIIKRINKNCYSKVNYILNIQPNNVIKQKSIILYNLENLFVNYNNSNSNNIMNNLLSCANVANSAIPIKQLSFKGESVKNKSYYINDSSVRTMLSTITENISSIAEKGYEHKGIMDLIAQNKHKLAHTIVRICKFANCKEDLNTKYSKIKKVIKNYITADPYNINQKCAEYVKQVNEHIFKPIKQAIIMNQSIEKDKRAQMEKMKQDGYSTHAIAKFRKKFASIIEIASIRESSEMLSQIDTFLQQQYPN